MSNYFTAPIAEEIWDAKYRMKEQDGTPIDLTVLDTQSRIANALAAPEKHREYWTDRFEDALADFKFLTAGRITAGAGTERDVTLFNCFVMGTIPDSMSGIFDMLKEAALTMQQGGGIGYDFSTIRPKGAPVVGVAADASGPLSFMDVWDAMCRTIMSAGSRRGAMMATMRCDHPDILDFVAAKADPQRLRMFNMSVLVTDEFMAAVDCDKEYDLVFNGEVYERVRARDVWDKIMHATYAYAEPGVIFIDRVNDENNLRHIETIAATNPCGEQPLPPYGACLLGSVNLMALTELDMTTGKYQLGEHALSRLVMDAVRMMDNVVDVSNFPLPQQEKEAKDKRRIGLGVTGLADYLALAGFVYGSDEALAETDRVMERIANLCYSCSAIIAAQKGAYPLWDLEEFKKTPMWDRLNDGTRTLIEAYGLRNALLTSIAPTGTISLYAGNVSSGIEPIFALQYERTVLQRDGSRETQLVEDAAVARFRRDFGNKELPASFVTAQDLPPDAHVSMQAVCQHWIDSSISKTVNLPADSSFEDFKDVYMDAYRLGCKGCTTYRPNDITGSVLTAVEPDKEEEAGGACELRFDENTGQLIRSCE